MSFTDVNNIPTHLCGTSLWEFLPAIDTPSKRSRLPLRKNPYWTAVAGGRGGVSLGYRRLSPKATGRWIAKIVLDGNRIEEALGYSDDDGAPHAALTYRQAVAAALEWSRRQGAAITAQREAGTSANGAPTVAMAIETHIARRRANDARNGGITAGRLTRHVLIDQKFAAVPLAKLRAADIVAWRARLPQVMAPATQNRLLGDLRAALNAAAEKYRRELPAHLTVEIKVGTRAAPVPIEERARKQFLSDDEVRRVIEVAFDPSDDGDYGRLILLAAATGARYSQLTTLTVADLQSELGRILLPGSKKGRSARAKPKIAVPISFDIIRRLWPAVEKRDGMEPLLTRWAHEKGEAPMRWSCSHRRAWGPAYEMNKLWPKVAAKAGLPAGTVMYALRHSSILRGLKAGLPVRLIAAQHDTSVEMIEMHYSAYIVDATEGLLRGASLDLAGAGETIE